MPFKKQPPLYGLWVQMRQRCSNPNFYQWMDYGGRGIRVCERWGSYAAFYEDMGPRPSPKHTLDRIDTDGNYEPSNCRWATRSEQQRNQRVTRKVTIEGIEYVAAALAEQSGLKTDTVIERAAKGLTLQEVLNPEKRVFKDGLSLGGHASGARKKAMTHCSKGHEYTPDNTFITPQGWRRCRACRRLRLQQRAA